MLSPALCISSQQGQLPASLFGFRKLLSFALVDRLLGFVVKEFLIAARKDYWFDTREC
jgi:hypothetical protein